MRASLRTDVAGQLDFEPVRRQPLDSERRPGTRSAGVEFLLDARDQIPPSGDPTSVEQVRLRVPNAAVVSVAFGPEPELIAVAADPSPGIDVHTRAASVRLPFELIEQHE